MAAGLGALYSQLPRKLVINDMDEINSSSASYLLGQDRSPGLELVMGVEQSSSKEFKVQLDSFLKLFEFCQDVLTRCPHTEISVRLLHSIRAIFLENILYPSILECSDTDGSSVAVLSYIDLLLQTLQQDALAQVVVGFLMNEEEENTGQDLVSGVSLPEAISLDTRRTSRYFTTAERFTLKDLIFTRLKSNSQPTVIATLKLLKTLIVKHCRYSLQLLTTEPDVCTKKETLQGKTSPSTWIAHHIREVDLYFSLISGLDSNPEIQTAGYEEYLQDIEQWFENDPCYQHSVNILSSQQGFQSASKSEKRRSFKYGNGQDQRETRVERHTAKGYPTKRNMICRRIKPTDPLLQILLGLLSHFFAQTSELNLALTGVIAALATCPYQSLEGWMSFCESDQTNPEDVLVLDQQVQEPPKEDAIRSQDIYATFGGVQVDEDDENDDRSVDYGVEKITHHGPVQFKSYPPLFTLFRTLTQQVDYYRSEIDEFGTLLEERWEGLLLGEAEVETRLPTPSISLSTRRLHTQQSKEQLTESPTPVRSISSFFVTPPPQTTLPVVVSNPLSHLAIHAQKTQSVRLQPLFPSNFTSEFEPILDLDQDDIVAFAPQAHPSQPKRTDKGTEITLAMLLNNVVILEETIKELIAIMQVRRSLGIDTVRYT
ncbi:Retinoic acid induced 16-like protein-domain-containing protein [Spinellus fusiger]|nr:Retinoic acid induced 16-like protein-domain-containing protein [Spinellus fusiger]